MGYTKEEVLEYALQEDVKFIRLAFCDIYGVQKNISIMVPELKRAFEDGISFDASAISGFGDITNSDLLLFPDPSTLSVLPWRPSHGRVIRLYCDIKYPDGREFEYDSRYILKKAIDYAAESGVYSDFGFEFEFYLFKTDEDGNATLIPHDNAGYMDIAPEDKGENVRREICLTLEEMGFNPESSHHEQGPGQHEIDFKYGDPLSASDNATTFKSVVRTIAARNGLYASFSPKPLANHCGNGLHINISARNSDGESVNKYFMAGIMKRASDITAFLNPCEESYMRLGKMKAPKYITWSHENRSQFIRIPASAKLRPRIELRSPDPTANPYIAGALLIYAGVEGVMNQTEPEAPVNVNLYTASSDLLKGLNSLPSNLSAALELASESKFIAEHIPTSIIKAYTRT